VTATICNEKKSGEDERLVAVSGPGKRLGYEGFDLFLENVPHTGIT
jgi:hypothetical protein